MRTLKNTFTIAIVFAIAFTFSASAQQKKPNAPVAKQQKGNVFTVVEKAPNFPGGTKAFGTYLSKNIKYPAADRENNVQGKVFVSFIVEPDGGLSEVSAIRGPSEAMKTEAVRVVKNSPKWIPGAQNGKKVRVQYTVPINFALGA